MRYFIAYSGSDIVEKQVFCGDESKADGIVSKFLSSHPNLTVSEVNREVFDATELTVRLSQAQKDWAVFKSTSPNAAQAITYIAKYLGLE